MTVGREYFRKGGQGSLSEMTFESSPQLSEGASHAKLGGLRFPGRE